MTSVKVFTIPNDYNIPQYIKDIYDPTYIKNCYTILDNFASNSNPKAIPIIDELLEYFHDTCKCPYSRFYLLFQNKNILHFIKQHIEYNIKEQKENKLQVIPDNIPEQVKLVFKFSSWSTEDHLVNLAKNTNDDALDLLSNFIGTLFFTDQVWIALCCNPNPKAFKMILENKDKYVNFTGPNLFYNPINSNCLLFLNLCENPEVIKYLEKNIFLINWKYLSGNPMAIELLLKNEGKNIYYPHFCKNSHPEAVKIILNIFKQDGFYSKKLSYADLFQNKSEEMVKFIKDNIDKIDENQIRIHKDLIFKNPSALNLIEKLHKMGYEITHSIWSNESIFVTSSNK